MELVPRCATSPPWPASISGLRGACNAPRSIGRRIRRRQAARPLGCEGAVAVERVVDVDDTSLFVRGDGDAPAQVCDHEVCLFVDDADAVAVQACRGFLVECVEDRPARAVGMAAQACHLLHLVDDHRVGDVGFDARHGGDLGGQQSPEVRGMFHRGVRQVAPHGFVDFVYAGRDGAYEPAASDDGRQLHDVEPVFGQRREDHFPAPAQLVDDVGVTCDLFGRVAQGQIQRRTLLVIEGDLGGSRAGIYR